LSVWFVGVFLGGRPVVSVSKMRMRMSVNIKKHWDCFIWDFNINFIRARVAVRCASLDSLTTFVPLLLLHSLCSARVLASPGSRRRSLRVTRCAPSAPLALLRSGALV
jgi:hypothetical protein